MSDIRGMKILAGIAVVALLAAVYGLLWWSGALGKLLDGERLSELVGGLGALGPLAVICLIAVAIVFSPIPSAPIALAAGAAYGHAWGTIYVILGAEAGALIAFSVARLLGYEILRRRFGDRLSLGLLGSQNTLMALVFVSRLLPFLSFDLISYAAGLTPLRWWRFAVATFAGIVPASFLLAHFGDEMASDDSTRILLAVAVLGLLTGLPLTIKALRARRGGMKADD